MTTPTRRDFLKTTALGAGITARGSAGAATYTTKLKKALILGEVTEDELLEFKAAGFEGVETKAWDVAPADAEKARALAEKHGMKIHSVMRAWTDFNAPAKLEEDIKSVETALKAAQGYGADAILLVPCRVKIDAIPEPWDFNIAFDEKSGHVTKVVDGDNAPFQEYITAQNYATDVSVEALKRLAPVAEETGVVIAVENVWNNLWVTPDFAKKLIELVDSPFVKCYFDIGNHVKYRKPEEWLHTLGKLIVKLHVKDFELAPDGHGGSFVNIREGSVDWPAVRQAIEDIGYNGWMTIEGSNKISMDERNKRLDLIIAGK